MSLFGTGTPNYGALLQGHESRRRGLIDLGLQQINAVYGGGSAPFYYQARQPGTRFDQHGQYYNLNSRGRFNPYWGDGHQPGAQVSPNGISQVGGLLKGIGDFGGGFAAKLVGGIFGNKEKSPREVAQNEFQKRHLFIKGNTGNFEGFQQPFYDERAKAYENYALPQLADQYRTNRDAINYGLSNRGLENSTVSGKAARDLERTTGQGKQQIADTGIAQANELKKEVEASRQSTISQLYQSADPSQGLQSAIANAANLRGPSVFAPLGDLFSNLARSYYVNQTLNNYRQGAGGYGNSNYGLSGAISGPTSY